MPMNLLSVFSSLREFQIPFLMSWFNNTNMDIIETAYSKYGEKICRLKYTRTAYNRAAKTYPIPKPTKSVVVEFLKWKSDHFRKKKPGRRIAERLRYRNKRMRHISIPANTPITNIHVTHSNIRDTLYDRSFFCLIAIHCRHNHKRTGLVKCKDKSFLANDNN